MSNTFADPKTWIDLASLALSLGKAVYDAVQAGQFDKTVSEIVADAGYDSDFVQSLKDEREARLDAEEA